MNARIALALRLAIRSHGGANRALTVLALSSISTAVTLAAGLDISARSVQAEIERTGDELAGAAQLEVVAGDVGVPEALLERIAATPGVAAAAPFLEATVTTRIADRETTLHVIGVDFLADTQVRDYAFAKHGLHIADPLRMLATPGSVVLSETLANELGIGAGSKLPVRRNEESFDLVVRGLLAPGGITDAFGGRIAVSDVFLLQALLHREGWLDRIEVVAAPETDLAALQRDLTAAVSGEATVRPSASRSGWVEATLATVRMIVSAMVIVAILVASLLSYAAMSLFTERRARELSLLRVTGLESARVQRFLWLDALLLGAVGSALGLLGGLVFARSFVALLTHLTAFLADVQVTELEVQARTVLLAFSVGGGVALAGMLPAARAVARQLPLEQLAAHRPAPPPPVDRAAIQWQLAIATAWVACWLLPLEMPPLVRVGALLSLGLGFLVVAARSPLPQLLAAARPFFERVLPGIGRLAGASLAARPWSTGLHVAAVAGVVAGVTVTAILEQSLGRTLDTWTALQFPGGIMVTPSPNMTFRTTEHIPADVVAEIRAIPGVSAVFEQYGTKLLFRGEEVLLSASDMGVMAAFGRLPAVGMEPRALAEGIAAGHVAVSDGFAKRFRVAAGDSIQLDTPAGARSIEVAGVMRDYAGPSGSLSLDLRLFDSLWPRPGARNLVVWSDAPPAEIVHRIEARIGARQPLFFAFGDELERFATRLLSRFTRILDLVAGLSSLLGGFAVMNLLLGAVAERRRELCLLRSTGATRGQVALLVLIDGIIAGAIGGVAGIALGTVCAYPLATSVVSDALGWSLDFSLDAGKLAQLLGSVAIASGIAGIYPAWVARGVLARDVLAPE